MYVCASTGFSKALQNPLPGFCQYKEMRENEKEVQCIE